MNTDPDKARAWQERSAVRAREKAQARARESGTFSSLQPGKSTLSRTAPPRTVRLPPTRAEATKSGNPRKAINPRSAKKAAADRRYLDGVDGVRVQVFARDGYRCQLAAVFPDVPCSQHRRRVRDDGTIEGWGLEVSHTIPRGRWRDGYLNVDNCLAACHAHGQYVHTAEGQPLAEAAGAMGHAWEADLLRDGWVRRHAPD